MLIRSFLRLVDYSFPHTGNVAGTQLYHPAKSATLGEREGKEHDRISALGSGG